MKETIILKTYSEDWGKEIPVTLIEYDNGTIDIHCQSGDHHDDAIEYAKKILKEQGMKVGKLEFVGPTGIYYPVTKIKSCRRIAS